MLSFCTRLIESRSLSEQHTPLEATSPVSTCSHRACVPGKACFSRFPFPSKGVWGPAPMSAHSPCPSALKCREHRICQLCTRRRKSVWQKVNAPPACANRAPLFIPECREHRICQLCTRRWQPFCQSAHARTERACRATLAFRAFPFPVRGYGGLPPCLPIAFALQLCYTKSKLENWQFFRIEQGGKA